MKIPYINLMAYELKKEEVKIIPVELALFHDIIVVDKIGEGKGQDILNVAIPYQDYYDTCEITDLRSKLSKRLGYNIQFVSAEAEVIEEKIHELYAEKSQVC